MNNYTGNKCANNKIAFRYSNKFGRVKRLVKIISITSTNLLVMLDYQANSGAGLDCVYWCVIYNNI